MKRAAMLALLLGACAPEPLEGHFACGDDSECPDGWSCVSGLCYSNPGDVDAGVVDAGDDMDAGDVDAGDVDAGDVDADMGDAGECLPATTDVDLLLMVDNSNSMVEEQQQLANSFPNLVAALVTGDVDGDGIADIPRLGSLHVGVITSDMGTGGHVVATCPDSDFGHDGRLRTDGDTSVTGCQAMYPSFLEYMPPGGQSAFTDQMACLTTNRRGGCGFEQQLEAVLKAVTPSGSPVRFYDNTSGHADGANAGFLRENSVLITLIASDEEDCSAADTDLFDPMSPRYPGGLNSRCIEHLDALYPSSRYAQGLAAAHPPQRTVFASLIGMPVTAQDLAPDAILALPDMQYEIDPMFSQLRPACTGMGTAAPGRRYIEVARDLESSGVGTVVHSICQPNYRPTWTAILEELDERFDPTCD